MNGLKPFSRNLLNGRHHLREEYPQVALISGVPMVTGCISKFFRIPLTPRNWGSEERNPLVHQEMINTLSIRSSQAFIPLRYHSYQSSFTNMKRVFMKKSITLKLYINGSPKTWSQWRRNTDKSSWTRERWRSWKPPRRNFFNIKKMPWNW
jgi:hypothetical protein